MTDCSPPMITGSPSTCAVTMVTFSIQVSYGDNVWRDYETGILRESAARWTLGALRGSESFRSRHSVLDLRLVRVTATSVFEVVG